MQKYKNSEQNFSELEKNAKELAQNGTQNDFVCANFELQIPNLITKTELKIRIIVRDKSIGIGSSSLSLLFFSFLNYILSNISSHMIKSYQL